MLWTLFALGILHLLAFCALRDAQYSWWFDFHAYKSRLDAEYRHELNLSDVAIECALRREPAHVNANASLCIAVATTRRKGTHYVRVLLGSFLRGTPKAQRDDAIVQLVAAGSAAHPDAEQLAQLPGIQLHRLFPTANVTSLAHSARVDLQLRSILLTTQLCVTHAHRVGAPYFVLLEDDGILADNFVGRVHDAVGTLDVDDPDWFVVKLFRLVRRLRVARPRLDSAALWHDATAHVCSGALFATRRRAARAHRRRNRTCGARRHNWRRPAKSGRLAARSYASDRAFFHVRTRLLDAARAACGRRARARSTARFGAIRAR
jgi:hypothetical protein